MFVVEMGDCHTMLGVEWSHTLGHVTMDFKELYMVFNKEGHEHALKGIKFDSLEIINSRRMEKLLEKGHSDFTAQFNVVRVLSGPPQEIPNDLHTILIKHPKVFETPCALRPSCGGHDHGILSVLCGQPPNMCPSRHPFS